MTANAVFFDLDGTLTDSGEGIIRSAALALTRLGLPVPDWATMGAFVGPPLDDTFRRFGVPAARTEEAVAIFRGRYEVVGKFENFPYPGVREMLQTLKDRGHPLYVATSKPEALAVEVLTHFRLADYFDAICGATYDGTRDDKASVIAYLLARVGAAHAPVMVGDTAYDVLGAAQHGIPTVGVAWGYGDVDEMRAAGAIAIAPTPEALPALIEARENL